MREAEGCSVMRTCIVLPSPQVSYILCPLGRGGTGGLCPACGLGTYADEEGLTECKQADPGTREKRERVLGKSSTGKRQEE